MAAVEAVDGGTYPTPFGSHADLLTRPLVNLDRVTGAASECYAELLEVRHAKDIAQHIDKVRNAFEIVGALVAKIQDAEWAMTKIENDAHSDAIRAHPMWRQTHEKAPIAACAVAMIANDLGRPDLLVVEGLNIAIDDCAAVHGWEAAATANWMADSEANIERLHNASCRIDTEVLANEERV